MKTKHRILLIDQHAEWLEFAQEVLANEYDVVTLHKNEMGSFRQDISGVNGFDLIFLGLELAANNLDVLKPLFKHWNFVVIFPIIQENDTVRLLFKAGVYDCAPKPYERDGLLRLVAEEIDFAKQAIDNKSIQSSNLSRNQTIKELGRFLKSEE
jgi:DNA-binding NtrC family response regulator